jgi:hypothetical protein
VQDHRCGAFCEAVLFGEKIDIVRTDIGCRITARRQFAHNTLELLDEHERVDFCLVASDGRYLDQGRQIVIQGCAGEA